MIWQARTKRGWVPGVAAALLVGGAVMVPGARAGAVPSPSAATWYVSSTGTDALTCGTTGANACLSIGYVMSNLARAGDLIRLVDLPSSPEAVEVTKDVALYVPYGHPLLDSFQIDSGVTLTLEEDSAAVISGLITGPGNLTEDDPNGNSLFLSPSGGSNTYAGTTDLVNGQLILTSSGSLPPATGLTVGPDGFLNVFSTNAEVASLSGTGVISVSTGTLTVDSTGVSPFTGSIFDYTGAVVTKNPPSLLMTSQPTDQLAPPSGSATFPAPAYKSNGSVVVQWQTSTDGGTTWTAVTPGPDVSVSNTDDLTLSALTADESGTQYRAQFTVSGGGASDVGVSAPATLFVSAATPAPSPPFVDPPGPPESAGTYAMALSFQPSVGCDRLETRLAPHTCTPGVDSFTDPVSHVTYTVDASNSGESEGFTVTGYEVNTSSVTPPPPSGSYVVGFAVAFSPGPSLPAGSSITLTITDPSIEPGDTIYVLGPGSPPSVVPVSTTPGADPSAVVGSGTATITFSSDPVFMVAAAPNASPVTPRQVKLIRLGGIDRIATAIAISQYDFPPTGSAKAVVLGRDDLFADDLAGSPFAASVGGPLLLSEPSHLDPRTAAEIARVLPAGGTVYVLGDTSALSAAVADSLTAAGYRVVRIGGVDRYTTAADLAQVMGSPGTVFEADGTEAGGAVSAAPAAISRSGAILLTAGATQSGPTAGYLSAHSPAVRYAVGAAPVSADSVASAVAGTNDDTTSVMVADRFFSDPSAVGIATDGAFPDALTGAATSEAGAGPTLLVPTDGPLPPEVAAYLETHPSVTTIFVYGGTAAVSDAVADDALTDSEAAS